MLAFLETVRIFGSKVSALARSRRSGALGLAARSQSTSALGLALTSRVLGPKVTNRGEDIPLAWDLGMLGPGTYELHIEMSESRENMGPWDVNEWSRDWEIRISQTG